MRIAVVIDMQPGFSAAHDKMLRKRIANRIRRHNECGDRVIVVEYKDHGNTYTGIMNAALENRHFIDDETGQGCVVEKSDDAGGLEVLKAAYRMNIVEPFRFVLMGVNTNCCVLDTARDILRIDPNASVVLPVGCMKCPHDDHVPEPHAPPTAAMVEIFCKDFEGRATRIWDEDEIG